MISILIITIGTSLTMGVYSVFQPYIENFSNIKNYSMAYYGAIGSIERAELTLRYHDAGFQGTGGWEGGTNIGPTSDGKPSHNFGHIASRSNAGTTWNIISRSDTGKIPADGKGDIEKQLQGTNSENYNKLEYHKDLEFPLDLDTTSTAADYYKNTNTTYSRYVKPVSNIEGKLRLPPLIFNGFGGDGLNTTTNSSAADIDGDDIANDILVNRSLYGEGDIPFTIFPTISVDYSNQLVNSNDSAIRECSNNNSSYCINSGETNIINIGGLTYNITGGTSPEFLNVIPETAKTSGGGNLIVSLISLSEVLSNGNITNKTLKLSLINLLQDGNKPEEIYPYLEYQLNFGKAIPDRYFTITGNGKIGDYDLDIVIRKPTIEKSGASDFTILF